MTLYNLGSINLDHVYRMQNFPAPGETLAARELTTNLGGKGLNISVAMQRAGADVCHIGAVQAQDSTVAAMLQSFDLDLRHIAQVKAATGHAIIYLDDQAENQIVIFPGANAELTEAQIKQALASATPADWLVLQNETNGNEMGIRAARQRGMKIALVAAPFDAHSLPALIDQVDLVSLNKGELADYEEAIGQGFESKPDLSFLLTYGAQGAEFVSAGQSHKVKAFIVDAQDTTGAGDTFFGGFMAQYALGAPVQDCLEFAAAMAALQVQSVGAASAIPSKSDVLTFLKSQS